MNRTVTRLAFSVFSTALLAMPAWPLGLSGVDARPAAKPYLALSAGPAHTVIAALKEQVKFVALLNMAIPRGEAIAIVRTQGHKLLNLCDSNPCLGFDERDKAGKYTYQALLTEAQVRSSLPPLSSKVVTVEWKHLTILPLFSDRDGGLKPGTQTDFSQVMGAPVSVSVSLPDGPATSWKTINGAWDDGASIDPCAGRKKGPCHFTKSCNVGKPCETQMPGALPSDYPPNGFTRTVLFEARDEKGHILFKDPQTYTFQYRPWNVTLEAQVTGKKDSTSTSSLSLLSNQSGTVNVKITEPNAETLSPSINGVEIKQRPDTAPQDDRGTSVKDCPDAITCPSPATINGATVTPGTLMWAEVYAKTADGRKVVVGRSPDVTVSSCPAQQLAVLSRQRQVHGPAAQAFCPAPKNLGIVYEITGGTGDCTPPPEQTGPLKGYTSCTPGKGGTVTFTAWAVTIDTSGEFGIPKYTETSVPPGYHFVWEGRNGAGTFGCDGDPHKSPCVLTMKAPGTGQIGLEGQIWPDTGSTGAIFAQFVTVLWAYFS